MTAAARHAALAAAVQQHVKYVFVIYQEGRSFDSSFGTFPGANGIYSEPAVQILGYTQPIENTDGTMSMIEPFRIGPKQIAADIDDLDHSHSGLLSKIDVTVNGPQMDHFALAEEQKHFSTALPTLQAKQYGELAMAHEDCDTIPLLWNFANKFVLFDNFFQSYLATSTPGALAIFSAQAGETQYGLHPNEGYTDNGASQAGVPVMNDRDPAWGPYNPGDGATSANVERNLTFVSLPLSLAGTSVPAVVSSDPTSSIDFADTAADVSLISRLPGGALNWGWFQEGYDQEPGESSAAASLTTYVTSHNAPQYFGYIANSNERANLHGLGDFYSAVSHGTIPGPGVFYIKGGYRNILGLKPANPAANVQKYFVGDDDHAGYSDAQISEANVAAEVNAIALSKYWSQSAIIITYDNSAGDYDHVAPGMRSIGPGTGNPPFDYLGRGPRVPAILISPFARDHYIDDDFADQGSVIKRLNGNFSLMHMGDLPDEIAGRNAAAYAGKLNYGPDDNDLAGTSDLISAFNPDRLNGTAKPLPWTYAYTNPAHIYTLPQQSGMGCGWIGMVPVDYTRGIRNNIPADFNPLPGTIPTSSSVRPIITRAAGTKAHDPDD